MYLTTKLDDRSAAKEENCEGKGKSPQSEEEKNQARNLRKTPIPAIQISNNS